MGNFQVVVATRLLASFLLLAYGPASHSQRMQPICYWLLCSYINTPSSRKPSAFDVIYSTWSRSWPLQICPMFYLCIHCFSFLPSYLNPQKLSSLPTTCLSLPATALFSSKHLKMLLFFHIFCLAQDKSFSHSPFQNSILSPPMTVVSNCDKIA